MSQKVISTSTSSSGFTFKQFHVSHRECAMKVGTDGILLGAWAPLTSSKQSLCTLDIGTGSGLISLMLAQRCEGNMQGVAIDIDEPACQQAKLNIESSPWPDVIKVEHIPLQLYTQNNDREKFDLIVSNPPYFPHGQAFDDLARQQARHTNKLMHNELIDLALLLLKPAGHLALVLPYDVGLDVVEHCQNMPDVQLYCVNVKTTPSKNFKRMLIDISFGHAKLQVDELIIHDKTGRYSDDYIGLTRDFYLKM